MSSSESYYSYLLTRSVLARYYRFFYLYPRINKNFRGLILDIGCGIGDFLRFRKNTIGIDINESIVEHCKNDGLNVVLFENGRIPFIDNYFDGVILDNVLEHIEDSSVIFLEIKRVVKKKSTLVIGVPGIRGYFEDNDHKIFYNEKKLNSLASEFGFTELKSFHVPFFKSSWLSRYLRQYCIYQVYINNN